MFQTERKVLIIFSGDLCGVLKVLLLVKLSDIVVIVVDFEGELFALLLVVGAFENSDLRLGVVGDYSLQHDQFVDYPRLHSSGRDSLVPQIPLKRNSKFKISLL